MRGYITRCTDTHNATGQNATAEGIILYGQISLANALSVSQTHLPRLVTLGRFVYYCPVL